MSTKGYTGISFPFRFSGTGSVERSTTSESDVRHVAESLRQIFLTSPGERVFRPSAGVGLRAVQFGNMDEVRKARVRQDIIKAVGQDKRVILRSVQVTEKPEDGQVAIVLDFKVQKTLASGRTEVARSIP